MPILHRLIIMCRRGLLASLTGLAAGSAAALFLSGLQLATSTRETHPWLLWLLPAGGAVMSWVYLRWGGTAAQGNPLIFTQIRNGEGQVPLRMGPLVLTGTWLTHLLGGSAGREGTAIQLGGSLASSIGRLCRVPAEDRSLLLLCGVSGGFGAVFGTPLAGTLFALEVAGIRPWSLRALLSALCAAIVGHLTATAWGATHIHYAMGPVPAMDLLLLGKVAIAAVCFGFAARLFKHLLRLSRRLLLRLFGHPVVRSAAGGIIIIVLVYAIGSREYLGLSLPLLEQSFTEPADGWSFALKMLFTVVTLGAGFQGGEVTPLFVIGAALGSALSGLLATPPGWLAAVGLVAVFAGAARAPLACIVLGLELFGIDGALYLFAGCMISWLCAGPQGLYQHPGAAQRPGRPGRRFPGRWLR